MRVFTLADSRERETLRDDGGEILQGMDSQIDLFGQQGFFQLLRKDTFAADYRQRFFLDVTSSSDNLNLDFEIWIRTNEPLSH
jgi:hypothetical protein